MRCALNRGDTLNSVCTVQPATWQFDVVNLAVLIFQWSGYAGECLFYVLRIIIRTDAVFLIDTQEQASQ